MSEKGRQNGRRINLIWELFWDNFPSKMHPKINAKIDAEKVMDFHEKCSKNDAKIDPQIMYFLVFSKNADYIKTLVLL